jgi:hypothetical protein
MTKRNPMMDKWYFGIGSNHLKFVEAKKLPKESLCDRDHRAK